MSYPIQKGIPIPGKGEWDFLDDMEVGDSFCIPLPMKSEREVMQVKKWGLLNQKTFTTKYERSSQTRRFWRVS